MKNKGEAIVFVGCKAGHSILIPLSRLFCIKCCILCFCLFRTKGFYKTVIFRWKIQTSFKTSCDWFRWVGFNPPTLPPPASVCMPVTSSPADYPTALDPWHAEGKALWLRWQPSLPVSPSLILPALCLLNLYGFFLTLRSTGATQYPLRRRGQRLTVATQARGLFFFFFFCMEPCLYPILHPSSNHVAEHKTHFWAHTKSAS